MLWFLPELWGSGNLLRSSERAQVPNPGQPALAERPALEVLQGFATMVPSPCSSSLGTTAIALFGGTGGRSSRRGRRRLGRLVAVMAEAGFSGEDRYLLAAAALSAVLGGVGAGALYDLAALRGPAGTPAAPILAVAVAAALPSARRLGDDLAYAAELAPTWARPWRAPEGPSGCAPAGHLYAGRYRFPLVAWHLRAHISDLSLTPRAPGSSSGRSSRPRSGSPAGPGWIRAPRRRGCLGGVRSVRRLARFPWALVALLACSPSRRSCARALDVVLWIDEGISAGIASHPAGEIPACSARTGPRPPTTSPARVDGACRHERGRLRAPSLVFALLPFPAALWAGWSLFGQEGRLDLRQPRRPYCRS